MALDGDMFAADGASRADRAQLFLRGRAYL
jgi:hypothetical protein